jgi:hypothetical protein
VIVARHARLIQHSRVGFYERKQEGFGVFRTPEDIEKRKPYATSDLFQSINGIRLIYMGMRGKDIIVTRGEDPNCSPSHHR